MATFGHDDDSSLAPAPAESCALVSGALKQSQGVQHTAQVTPYAGDRPAARLVELWAAVIAGPPGGKPVLDLTVTGPTGHAIGAWSATPVSSSECAAFGKPGESGTMLGAAIGTGQVTTEAAAEIAVRCARGEFVLYHGSFGLSHRTECGAYRVEAAITGSSERRTVSFDDQCFISIARDFERIQWGNITPGQEARLRGDLNFNPGDGHPSLRNDGNAPAGVAVAFDALVPVDASGTPIAGQRPIDHFGACLGNSSGAVACISDVTAGALTPVGLPGSAICPGETARLDPGAMPGPDVKIGGYSGSLRIVGVTTAAPCPAGLGH